LPKVLVSKSFDFLERRVSSIHASIARLAAARRQRSTAFLRNPTVRFRSLIISTQCAIAGASEEYIKRPEARRSNWLSRFFSSKQDIQAENAEASTLLFHFPNTRIMNSRHILNRFD
jgi:hypothetical protein